MTICVQDRDQLLFDITEVKTKKHYYKGQLMGWNLYGYDNNNEEYLLGTFDDETEAYSEILKIHLDENPIKHVTIYWQYSKSMI